MQRIISYCLTLFTSIYFCTASCIPQKGILFFTGNWKEVVAEAQAQNKLIFIDAFTSWCVPCKKMAKNIFINDTIGNFFNTHFINYKINAETGEGPQIKAKYNIGIFPSLFFVNPSEDLVLKSTGSKSVQELLALGKEASGKSNLPISNYETSQSEPDKFLSELSAYEKTADWTNYGNIAITNLAGNCSLTQLNIIAWNFYQNISDTIMLAKMETILANAIKTGKPSYYILDTHAAFLHKLGRKEDALKQAKKAIQKAKETDEDYLVTTELIGEIKAAK